MEIRNLNTFLRAAELGSFTKAATDLNYAQSTVTAQIQQLEDEIGMALFERIGRKVVLTYTGRQLITYANEMKRISEQIQMLGVRSEEAEGSIRIGILESLLASVLTPLLPQYVAAFPNISIEIKTSTTDDLFQMLGRNEIDLIFILKKRYVKEEFVCMYAQPENVVFVTSPKNPLAHQGVVPLTKLLREPFIMTEKVGQCRGALEEYAAQHNDALKPYIQLDNSQVIVDLLKKGLGVSFLAEYACRSELVNGTLVTIPVDMEPIQIWSQVFRHKNKWVTPQMEGFIALLGTRPE